MFINKLSVHAMLLDLGSNLWFCLFIGPQTIAFDSLDVLGYSSYTLLTRLNCSPYGLRPIPFSVYASPLLLPLAAQDSIWSELGHPSPAGLSPASSVTLLGAQGILVVTGGEF